MFKRLAIVVLAIFLSNCSNDKIDNRIKIRVDNFPQYGQPSIKRSEKLKQVDEKFIKKVVAKVGNRKKASTLWWQQGEKFMQANNADYAMRRYNQAWLLDPDNYQPYWGFSRVMTKGGNIDEAIKYLEKSASLINDDFQKPALLSDLATAYTIKGKNDASFYGKANLTFAQSIALDPNYGAPLRRWAYSLYAQGRYAEALEKVNRAKALNAKPFSEKFIIDLKQKLN